MRVPSCAVVLATIALVGFPARGDDVDRYIETQIRRLHIPGLALAVVRDGEIVKVGGYGRANLELDSPVTPATVFEIGSISKQFTAAAVMMLVEEEKLALDESVRKHIPEAPEAWQGITIRHLLSHTSGIQNHVAVPGYLRAFRTNLMGETVPEQGELLKMFFQLPLEFAPGETWAYDNTGYYLLGIIIERVSGTSYWQFLDERIFKPLGMTSTRNTDPVPLVRNRASGYEWTGSGFENRAVLLPPIAFSAGSLLSTVQDMAKWDAALNGERLMKRATRELMWTPVRAPGGGPLSIDYGLGWFIESYRGRRIVQHSGGTPGFSSVIYRFVDDRLTVILLSNHSDRLLDQMAIDLAGLYVPALKRPEKGTDGDPKTTERLRTILAQLLAGSHDPSMFTPAMATFLTTTTGKGLWQWFSAHGELGALTFSGSERVDGMRVLRFRAHLGGNPYWFSFMLDPAGKIAQLRWW